MATSERYETKSGAALYVACCRKPDKRQMMRRGFATKRDAQLFAATVEVSKAKGEYVAPKLGRVSVGELAPNWLARKQRATAPSHYRMLNSAWRVHVQPHWGTVPVAEVDLLAVEEWIASMVDKGAGATTVLRAYGVLSGILADAVKGKRLAANPWSRVWRTCPARRPDTFHGDVCAGSIRPAASTAFSYQPVVIDAGEHRGLGWPSPRQWSTSRATATVHAVAAKWLRQELVCARKVTQQRVSVGVEPCRRARRVALLVDERQL